MAHLTALSMITSRLHSSVSWIFKDRTLCAALLLAIGLSLIGANWGRVECWNLDNMALRRIFEAPPAYLPESDTCHEARRSPEERPRF